MIPVLLIKIVCFSVAAVLLGRIVWHQGYTSGREIGFNEGCDYMNHTEGKSE